MNSSNQFEAVVSEHYEVLFRFAISLTQSQLDAEDLTQQTFYTWAVKGHQLRDESKVKTWLFTTLHHTFLAAQRRHSRFSHHSWESVLDELPPVEAPEPSDDIGSSQVLAALGEVDEVYQSAVALFYLDDFSYAEIACSLQIPVGTVKSRLSRGLTQLRRILTRAGVFIGRECSDQIRS